ncbi:hypothetical protein [Telmatospirillum sp.]|uniref:hypothetical protein n=1 Tax=Telmatospirillum sp. TaxID=2079197 RepID=UPI00284D7386|nr:hypothetical protein [Telmatospirillum sp.]MDR3439103.1 hypothetical protein [Telmatospirillum sp.]
MMRRLGIALMLVGALHGRAANAAQDAPPIAVVGAVGAQIDDLSVTDADTSGAIRWATWSDGDQTGRATHLALFARRDGTATLSWSTTWKDAYHPTLRSTAEWAYRGHPVLAVTVQFGAGAEQIDLYGLDEAFRPMLLVEKEAASVGWMIGKNGKLLLMLYSPSPTVLKATCYGWQGDKGTIAREPCS